MKKGSSAKVIFDTNIWISFLIGKKLRFLKDLIVNRDITLVMCTELMEEIEAVAQRPHLKKYNTDILVAELKTFLDLVAESYPIVTKHNNCRDAKDNFLLDLIDVSKADYMITGDRDLLVLDPFLNARIITAAEFERLVVVK